MKNSSLLSKKNILYFNFVIMWVQWRDFLQDLKRDKKMIDSQIVVTNSRL